VVVLIKGDVFVSAVSLSLHTRYDTRDKYTRSHDQICFMAAISALPLCAAIMSNQHTEVARYLITVELHGYGFFL
jgi:hypothetical protein